MNEINTKLKDKLKKAGYDLNAVIDTDNNGGAGEYAGGMMQVENEEMERGGNTLELFLEKAGMLKLR